MKCIVLYKAAVIGVGEILVACNSSHFLNLLFLVEGILSGISIIIA